MSQKGNLFPTKTYLTPIKKDRRNNSTVSDLIIYMYSITVGRILSCCFCILIDSDTNPGIKYLHFQPIGQT